MWEYTDKVKKHFLDPQNVGEIEKPDASADVGNISCGDALHLTLKIDKKTNIILDAKFKTFGCGSAIASSSVLTELIIGKTVEEAKKITNQDIVNELGSLPKEKIHCSVMGEEALEKALAQYLNEDIPEEHTHDSGKIVCKCFGITDSKIARLVTEHGLHTVGQVTNFCKAGGACTQCISQIEDIIHQVHGEQQSANIQKKPMTNVQKIMKIQQVIDSEIRPKLESDGGDIELVDVIGNEVFVSLRGNCSGCRLAEFTLKDVVEQKLKEMVDKDLFIKEIKS